MLTKAISTQKKNNSGKDQDMSIDEQSNQFSFKRSAFTKYEDVVQDTIAQRPASRKDDEVLKFEHDHDPCWPKAEAMFQIKIYIFKKFLIGKIGCLNFKLQL